MTLVRRDTPLPEPSDDEIAHNIGALIPRKRGTVQPARPAEVEPARPAEVEQPVEAEVVSDTAEQPVIRAWSRRLPAPVQRAASGKTAERAAITAVGMASLAGRAWDGASHGVYRRQIKSAEATGNGEALERWTGLSEEAKQRRHERLLQLPRIAGGMFGIAVIALAAVCLLTLMVAVFAPLVAGWSFTGTLAGGMRLVGILVWAFAGTLLVIVALAPFAIIGLSYREGQRRGDKAPAWLTVNRPGEEEVVIVTPLGVAEAIAHLSIQSLDKAIRDGWQIAFDTPPMRVNNRGYQTVFSLPMGVTPDMIADKRAVLARNLHRDPMEVWPTAAARPGYVDLWVADSGSAARPTPDYPLLHDGQADVFVGVPTGIAQRGDEIMFPIVGANFVAGGQMGQGKSNLCRVVMLGCATDPLADLWVHVFAGNGDFDAYRPRLSRYLRGGGDDIVWAGLQSLQELYEETDRRETRLAELGAKKVTRGLAEKHPDLRPTIALFSECFPAGTTIGGTPIQYLRPGDVVPSWDEGTGRPCLGVVRQVFRRPVSSLVRVHFTDGASLTCTPNHPLMTSDGWKDAGTLSDLLSVLSWSHEQFPTDAPVRGPSNTGDVRDVQWRVHDHRVLPSLEVEGREARVLLAGVPDDRTPPDRREGPDGNEGARCSRAADAGIQPDGESYGQGQVIRDAAADGASATSAASRWTVRAAEAACGCTWLAGGGDRSHQDTEAPRGAADVLLAGHRQSGTDGGDRGGRRLALQPGAAGTRRQEGSVAAWLRVDRVEVLEPGSDDRYGGLCPDGHVYNLEVTGTHVYLVGDRGIVAHNCHELFGSDLPLYEGAPKSQTVGKAAAEYATKTLRRARKTGITLGFDTQSSRADAIPPKIVELVGVNACFSVKTWRSNDGFLGDGSFQAGVRATELRFNVDRGTCLVTGASDEVFEIVKTFFIEVDDDAGRDDATPVIARCLADVKDTSRLGGGEQPRAIESRDLLEDVAAVLSDEPVRAAEIPGRLRKLAPAWAPYRQLTGVQLRERLDDEYGLVVPSTHNRYPVSPEAVHAVLSDRRLLEADLTDEPD